MKQKMTAVLAAAVLTLGVTGTAQAGTLEDVQSRGVLRCVVSTGIAGFAQPDANGVWGGFDVDFCRATAAAVLGDAGKIEAVTSTGKTRFTKLNAGEGDVLWRNTTVTTHHSWRRKHRTPRDRRRSVPTRRRPRGGRSRCR